MRLRSPRQLTQDGPSGREAVHTLKVFCRRPISPMSAVGRKLSARERPNPSPKCGYPRRKRVAVVGGPFSCRPPPKSAPLAYLFDHAPHLRAVHRDERHKVPARPDWLHEIKHDGYRLIVQREGERVRLHPARL